MRGMRRGEEGEGEEDISMEEVRRMTRKLKERKAMEIDGLPNEVWKYGGEGMVKSGYGGYVGEFGKGRDGRMNGRRER